MTIRRIKSGGIYEDKVGYCRAVVAGGFVHVAGTTAQGDDIPRDVIGQCKSALDAIKAALEEAGSGLDQVVRVTYMLENRKEFERLWPLLSETFGANPPAVTMIECNLVHRRYRIEIEVTALAPNA
ncbi:MAG: Rid family hydrolase [Aestuariivita sp.]|nr:Rid family hydrolase [Aestuariivita sp.]MCY4203916.1 Rid family hydrolase [Aestuariivita sp.]MCY4287895.1 Rid family hydrolase [Aestuariivita sp.]MCY4345532.1 Rid family hydrolase [Aestuariivita sp.]